MCQETQQWFGWAYTESVKWRLKFNNRLDKALETLERAEIRLGEKEEQEWIENRKGSVESAHKQISRRRAEVYYRSRTVERSIRWTQHIRPGFSGITLEKVCR